MKEKVCVAGVVLFLLLGAVSPQDISASPPVRLIFDTDMGNDVDDAMALSVIHALQSFSECRLLAVTLTKDNPNAVRYVDLLNTFYGRGDIPVGIVRGGVLPGDGKYLKRVATAADDGKIRYPHDLLSQSDVPEATELLRKVLGNEPDGSVVIAQVGFSTNLARLLDSKPDRYSPLGGKELVRKKVRLLSVMAGIFDKQLQQQGRKEFNVVKDVPAAQKVFHEWPTPIVFSGWNIGARIKHPGKSMREDYSYVPHHPLAEAYSYYRGLDNDQPTYDLTSVLYAVRPDRDDFGLSPAGRVTVGDDGSTVFEEQANGPHRYLTVTPEQIDRVRSTFVELCRRPPDAPKK